MCIISSLDAGGAETFLMKVYRVLPPEKYQLDFVVSKDGGCYTQEVLERGGKIYTVPLRTQDLRGVIRGIAGIVRENGYRCVLKLGEGPLSVVDLIAAQKGGAKRLAMRSCNALTGLSVKQKLVDSIFRPVLGWVANVKIAPSMLAAEYTFGKRRARKDVHFLHNGVDLCDFHFDQEGRARIRKEFLLEDKFVVGHIGRFHEQKNHGYLLEVFRAIKDRREDAAFLVTGTGALEDTIRQRVKELGLEDAVVFTGLRFDVPQLLSAMDVFVFPSLYEGMPNTVIEAQATGLPCVIADTITPEADLTGLVRYLSLEQTHAVWAETALAVAANERRDTAKELAAHGYDIRHVAQELMDLICGPSSMG